MPNVVTNPTLPYTQTGDTCVNFTASPATSGDVISTGTVNANGSTFAVSRTAITVYIGVSFTGGITNQGTISANGVGIFMDQSSISGSIVNATNAAISGRAGIQVSEFGSSEGLGGSIVNNGSINASADVGIGVGRATIGGGITNSGTVSSALAPISVSFDTIGGSVVNTGKLVALSATVGMSVANGGSIAGSVLNSGTISVPNRTNGIAIQVQPNSGSQTIGGSVVNDVGGTLSAGVGIGLLAFAGPTAIVTVQGNVVNNGTIMAGLTGIQALSATIGGGVTNTSTITAGEYGIQLTNLAQGQQIGGPSTFNFTAGPASIAGSVVNSGSITSTGTGFAGIVANGADVSNGITNAAGATIDATNGVGILLSDTSRVTFTSGTQFVVTGGPATVSGGITNNGTIAAHTAISVTGGSILNGGITNSGTLSGAVDAINLTGEGAPTAINVLGGTINGNIVGGGSDTVNFTLGAGNDFAYASTISGVTSVHVNSGTLEVLSGLIDPAAVTVASGATILLGNGGGVAGNIADNGTFGFSSGTATYGGVISGNGVVEQIGGTGVLTGADNVTGATDIKNGTLELGLGGSIAGNATFTTASATLQFDTGMSQLGGLIAGAVTGDDIDLRFQAHSSGDKAVWQQNGATGTLMLETSGGSVLDTLTLSGQYTSADFSVASDNHGGTSIMLVMPANPPPPAGTTANMITVRGSDGTYEIYDLGHNAELAAYPLTQIASPAQAAALGNFSGTGTTDMAVRNGNAFEYVDVANNNVTQTGVMGAVGTQFSVVGTGKFDSTNFTDMMMEKTTGAVDTYDAFIVRNNQFVGANQIAAVGSQMQLLGFGDVNGDGTSDMVLRNSSNNTLQYYDIANGQLQSSGVLGAVGSEWQIVGFGNFDNSGFSDMIMRNSNTNAYDLFDIRNNQIVGAHQIAAVGSQLQLAGFADINGDGTQDMVLRDSRNGSFEYYDIVNGQVTAEGVLGQSGLEWTVVGLTDDPAATNTSAAPSSDLQAQPAEGGRDAWLTQAMQAAGAGGQSSLAGTTPAAGPGFDSGSSLTTGSTEWAASPVVTQNVLQQQHIA